MPTTTPNRVRKGLAVVTAAALADLRAVAASGRTPSEIRASLFAASPLIVGDYGDGAAALALDWYDELRDAASPRHRFTPTSLATVAEDKVASSVAWATASLYDLDQDLSRMTEELLQQATRESLALLEPVVQKDVAGGFWDTMTGNSVADPDAVGWQRFTRDGACKFCLMLAGRGDVYTQATANFAAHTTCHCVAGPSFDSDASLATAMQYVASKATRTDAERAALRDYLNQNYPDAPG
jgi:hypothetical protein